MVNLLFGEASMDSTDVTLQFRAFKISFTFSDGIYSARCERQQPFVVSMHTAARHCSWRQRGSSPVVYEVSFPIVPSTKYFNLKTCALHHGFIIALSSSSSWPFAHYSTRTRLPRVGDFNPLRLQMPPSHQYQACDLRLQSRSHMKSPFD